MNNAMLLAAALVAASVAEGVSPAEGGRDGRPYTDAALYRAGDHLYSLAKTDGDALLMLEYDSGRLSRLRGQDAEYVAGPSIGVDSPVTLRVSITKDAMTIDHDGTRIVAQHIEPFTTEEITLRSGDVTLAGTLYLPRSAGRHPAMVAVPGGGNATRRSMALPAPYFARRGIAVLALDKRGDGQSGGDWRTATFEDLANDVMAAMETLRTRREIDPKRIGIYASSQGGWIAPIAAAKSPAVAFVVCAACPATAMPQQELIRTEYELRADGFSDAEIRNAVEYRRQLFQYLRSGMGAPRLEQLDDASKSAKWYVRFGGIPSREAPVAQWWRINDRYDPVEWWRRAHVPALLLFGERDTRVPPAEHARRLSAVNGQAKVVIISRIDHEGFLAHTGGRDEVPRLDRIPPRAMEPAIDWILSIRP
jgi:uncharacterized protein